MHSFRFSPRVDGLEDRTTPTVSAAQVLTSYAHYSQVAEEIKTFLPTMGDARTSTEISFIASHFSDLVVQSNNDAAALQDFLDNLRAQIASNPQSSATLTPLLGGVGFGVYQSHINAAYAELIAEGFGAPAPSPPVSPPPTTDNGPVFSNNPLPAGTSSSNPAGSTLPFSLGDPAWQNLTTGVRTWDVTVGSGATVQAGDKVSLNYKGYLTSGTIFDSNTSTTSPFQTTLSNANVIQGFVLGIAGMKVGGTRRIDIPASLAYGANPPSSSIPANAELVFEVTLLSSP